MGNGEILLFPILQLEQSNEISFKEQHNFFFSAYNLTWKITSDHSDDQVFYETIDIY